MMTHPPALMDREGGRPFWNFSVAELTCRLQTGGRGLSDQEARRRRAQTRPRIAKSRWRSTVLGLLLAQFRSPITLILLFAASLALMTGQRTDMLIILVIVLGSGLLGFWQERNAADAVEALLAQVRIKTTVVRDGHEREVPGDEVVPGDIVALNAGDVIPGDCLILESKDLYLDEAMLTGETYPVEKSPGVIPADVPPGGRRNGLFQGTHVVSGTARALVVATGDATEFSRITHRMTLGRPETGFERGLRHFGYFLMEVTLLLVLGIFAINASLGRPILDSFLFSLALAVGLTPQLLPAIVSINLAQGAGGMARRKVIVKRLASIEDFGGMDVLCVDKTGTLTEGVVRLKDALDFEGNPSEKALLHAALNAAFETGFTNPIDEAIRASHTVELSGYQKRDEVPYDFVRKRLSVLVERDGRGWMATKGALTNILEVCSRAETAAGRIVNLSEARAGIERQFEELGSKGYRTLGVAYRELAPGTLLSREHEAGMTFLGVLVLHDPPKPGIAETVGRLRALGISLKMITGDNQRVAAAVGRFVGLNDAGLVTGQEIRWMSDEALVHRIAAVEIFAAVEPNQKERVLRAIRKAGNVVGFLGDGINDAAALHAADVGLSVNSAVDVAKEAADIVLLEKDLGVLVEGVREGRKTYANTLKYVYIATSANFGNMVSMACISPFLSYLPLLPKQILLNNLLTDIPEMAIATDRVDAAAIEHPRRWEIRSIRRFMIVFGALSTLFDFATFGLLLHVLHATPVQFRTGWFVESVVSAAGVVLVVRTGRPLFKSRPGTALIVNTILVCCATLALPFTPLGPLLGFGTIPGAFYLGLGVIVASYVVVAELAKRYLHWTNNRGLSG